MQDGDAAPESREGARKMVQRRVSIEIHNNGENLWGWSVKFEGSENIWADDFCDSILQAAACAAAVVDKIDPPRPRVEWVTPSDCTHGGED
jgi:hypothetical protein